MAYKRPHMSRTEEEREERPVEEVNEKRVSHIASEQKRRNTIRTGFKELTDIIPTLKNINNSKSTILFKAVEYIRYMDRRNRSLRDKLTTLQHRLSIEMDMKEEKKPDQFSHLPIETISALMAHKKQERKLRQLQVQLRLQQELLIKHNIMPHTHYDIT
ncbi:hypothetical protein BDB01DRAFT_806951 [Pilobolus umbonatus]|nr:hypothetical protein BDB01DRAFT_806951 [Pilobolus umbonatus]